MAELLSKGIRLEITEDATGASPKWRRLYGLTEVPDMGGDVERIEVTNLEDTNKRYIDGIADYGDLEFKFFYNRESTPDVADSAQVKESYSILRNYQSARKSIWYRLMYPDGTGHQWRGGVNVKRSGASVGAALEFSLTTALETEMEDIESNE